MQGQTQTKRDQQGVKDQSDSPNFDGGADGSCGTGEQGRLRMEAEKSGVVTPELHFRLPLNEV